MTIYKSDNGGKPQFYHLPTSTNLTLAGFSLSADPTKFMAVFFLLLEEDDTVLADPAALTTAEPASMQPPPPPPAP